MAIQASNQHYLCNINAGWTIDHFGDFSGVIQYGGMKIDFSQMRGKGLSDFDMPVNVGLPDFPLDSSRTHDILDALREAASCDVVIIDFKEGQAWWETRLLVLLAGAVRRKKPEKVVFVG